MTTLICTAIEAAGPARRRSGQPCWRPYCLCHRVPLAAFSLTPRRATMTDCNLVLIGPPGSGKGTQAARIAERYRVPGISTGETLRAAGKEDTPLGRQAKAIMAAGGLVSDEIMIDL